MVVSLVGSVSKLTCTLREMADIVEVDELLGFFSAVWRCVNVHLVFGALARFHLGVALMSSPRKK